MNTYKVRFQFTKAFFHQNVFDEIIKSKLNMYLFNKQLKKELIDNNEMYRVVEVNQVVT